MSKALIADLDEFTAFVSAQPLCRWAAQKQADIAAGKYKLGADKGLHLATAPQKNDNADLMAALSSMA